jgi:hypothetical protein
MHKSRFFKATHTQNRETPKTPLFLAQLLSISLLPHNGTLIASIILFIKVLSSNELGALCFLFD